MENTGKNNNLHMVQTDWDEIERKVREHRKKQLRMYAIIAGVCAALIISYIVCVNVKLYTGYRITEQIERSDTAGTEFIEYNGGFLKCSNDGAIYATSDNETIWNQSFEMQEPVVSVCEKYVAIADREGKTVYEMNEKGLQNQLDVNMPIIKMDVASNGTLAVLMEEDDSSYLALYNSKGEQVAEGAIHVENGGTPMDIALSYDGKKLGISILNFNDGKAQTTINFYNFGTVGQNQIDNIVSTYDYADTVIPSITFINDNRMIAFADNGVYTFEGSEKPQQEESLTVTGEIQSIFYNESYFGLVTVDADTESARNVHIYNMRCSEVSSFQTTLSYSHIGFLDNNEICLYNEKACQIYKNNGKEKLNCMFEGGTIDQIFHSGGIRGYLFLFEEETERVRLSLFNFSQNTESTSTTPTTEVQEDSDLDSGADEETLDQSEDVYDIDAADDTTQGTSDTENN